MAFEGNLKDFSLADVVRLIASGKKSGTLRVEWNEMEGKVCFRDGDVCFASAAQGHEPIGKKLLLARIITAEQLKHALSVQRSEKGKTGRRRLGQILVDEGHLDAAALEKFVREQIIDTLFDLFSWNDGTMRFEATEGSLREDVGLALPVEPLIEETTRRLEQWDKMGSCIPSLDARFEMSATPAESAGEIYLKPREWDLLCHMRGGRGIRELAEATGYTFFETARTLYGMVSAGLVAALGEDLDDAAGSETLDDHTVNGTLDDAHDLESVAIAV